MKFTTVSNKTFNYIKTTDTNCVLSNPTYSKEQKFNTPQDEIKFDGYCKTSSDSYEKTFDVSPSDGENEFFVLSVQQTIQN
jgi:hypothetical protein